MVGDRRRSSLRPLRATPTAGSLSVAGSAPSASAWRVAESPVGRVRMPHRSRFCGCLLMSHVKNLFLLLSCVFIAAASLGQTSDAAKAKQPVATVDGQTIYEEDLAA